ncbi:hypothetical protein GYMLUDRAFT_248188 [Collybiopsis luxurians FD-317 M1]|uniref:receptor protein-tyrosine kinase n=1 Tax=Collybiopsis luxurians FD-317 M1 TaxID=944289 RepID=A0A0D0CLF4_9AGAR|nr:hypothetical protein GYMLUDRAFT_248188 [Collybiopsis luxurians FD-317 M1]
MNTLQINEASITFPDLSSNQLHPSEILLSTEMAQSSSTFDRIPIPTFSATGFASISRTTSSAGSTLSSIPSRIFTLPTASSSIPSWFLTLPTASNSRLTSPVTSIHFPSSATASSFSITGTRAACCISKGFDKSDVVSFIAGGVIGSIVGLTIVILTIFFLLRRRNMQRNRYSGSRAPFLDDAAAARLSSAFPFKWLFGRENGLGFFRQSDYVLIPDLPEPPSFLGDTTDSTIGLSDSGGSRSMQSVEARLEYLQNTMAWMVEHVQRLESQREYDGNPMTGRSDAPLPTYGSK